MLEKFPQRHQPLRIDKTIIICNSEKPGVNGFQSFIQGLRLTPAGGANTFTIHAFRLEQTDPPLNIRVQALRDD
jgi:hypothetical protein